MFNKAFDLEKPTDKFNGFYRGVVVDVKDPTESGRIRIKVYPMFEGVKNDTLPWAIPADSTFGGSANVGSSAIPIINSHVFVFFENGDFRFPVYFASAPAIQNGVPDIPTLTREDDGTVAAINSARTTSVTTAFGGTWSEPVSAYSPVYPKNKVFRSESGIVIEIDDTPDNVRFHVYHPSGTRKEIDNSGNEVEHVSAKKTTVIIGDNNIEVKGNQNTTTGSTHGVKIGTNGKVDVGNNYDVNVGSACSVTTGASCNISAGSTSVISAGTNSTISASGNVVISAGGTVTVTGSSINLN